MSRFIEHQIFKRLFLKYYIPATNKSVNDDLNELKKSKYKDLIVLTEEDLKENLYETIRLGYVGLFHKYENYRNELIKEANLFIGDTSSSNIDIKKYLDKEFGLDIKNLTYSKTLERVNWICNCVKHTDALPRRKPKPQGFEALPEDTKLKLNKEDLEKDADNIIELCQYMLMIVLQIAVHFMFFDRGSEISLNEETDVAARGVIEVEEEKLKNVIVDMIESLKQI